MSWFDTGFSKAHKETAKDVTNNDKQRRFWVPKDGTQSIIFLDNFDWRSEISGENVPVVPFALYEHQVQVDGDFRNPHFFTCSGRGCPLCQAKYTKKRVSLLSVLNLWTDKEGKARATKQILPMFDGTALLIEGKKEKKGNLRGLKYSVSRTEDKSPRVGNDYEYEENVGDKILEMFPDVDLNPYTLTAEEALEYYKNLFMPKPEDEIRSFLDSYNCSDGYVFKGGKGSVTASQHKSSDIDY